MCFIPYYSYTNRYAQLKKMNRLTRITSILTQLQTKKIISAKEIANRFEISLRTVYRDIKTLQEAGVPIGSENGVGYFIVDGYSLPPIMITEEEANSLVISQKYILNQGDTSLIKNFSSVLFKIKSVLKNSEKEKFSKLENKIAPSYINEPFISNNLSQIQLIIANNQIIEIIYHSLSKNEKTIRLIKPLGLYFSNRAWILIAQCTYRNELREFRLDRILNIQETSQTNEYQDKFNLTEYFIQKYQPKLT